MSGSYRRCMLMEHCHGQASGRTHAHARARVHSVSLSFVNSQWVLVGTSLRADKSGETPATLTLIGLKDWDASSSGGGRKRGRAGQLPPTTTPTSQEETSQKNPGLVSSAPVSDSPLERREATDSGGGWRIFRFSRSRGTSERHAAALKRGIATR